ncbi:protein BTG3 [Leptinotarsa decemlineata]|uniref:protein BTG3 n=1 Tax=Leptinotarsa decemlineata TaxID=7539 RepID=UPI000C2532EA|nr:protein BTG3-like [Leptinotarsa decemlineata]XP_023014452.1 protein BTG3-like [Leptinotarsa decemlineata]
MKEEITTAVMFFINFIEKSDTFPREQLENFKKYLTELLIERFEKHWFPNLPTKGQAYRCIRVNCVSPVDETLLIAANKCGFKYDDLRLPTEITVWVDPNEVCYRLGESEGSYCTLATFSSESSSESARSTPTMSNSPPSTPHQEKPRKVQRTSHQRYNNSVEYPSKYRNHSSNVTMPSFRVKTSPREMNFNFHPNRPMYRCDGPPYPLAPAFFRNVNHNRTHKNVLRV